MCPCVKLAGDCDIQCILGVVLATLTVLFIAGFAILCVTLIYLRLRSKHSTKSSNAINLSHNVAYGDLVSRKRDESNLSRNEDVEPAYDYPDNIIGIQVTPPTQPLQPTCRKGPIYDGPGTSTNIAYGTTGL